MLSGCSISNLALTILEDQNLENDKSKLVTIYCDSQETISYTKDVKYHSKSKHIETKYNFVMYIMAKKNVTITYIPTHEI